MEQNTSAATNLFLAMSTIAPAYAPSSPSGFTAFNIYDPSVWTVRMCALMLLSSSHLALGGPFVSFVSRFLLINSNISRFAPAKVALIANTPTLSRFVIKYPAGTAEPFHSHTATAEVFVVEGSARVVGANDHVIALPQVCVVDALIQEEY